MKRTILRTLAAILSMSIGGLAKPAHGQSAEPYRVGPGDVLSVTFWQQPTLNQAGVLVRQDGMIALPVIGELEVSGLTLEEASDRIVDRISRYIPSISQALVQVVTFNAREIIVTGQVKGAGQFTFEVLPNLWGAIRRAGGPTEDADLAKVTVLEPSGVSTVVDLKSLIAQGRAESLPPLASGTTVDVPRRLEFMPPDVYGTQRGDTKPVVYVTGQVVQPGPKPIEGTVYIYDALALAGGFGPEANPSRVQVISKGARGPVTKTFNLSSGAADRTGMTYRIQNEDMIIVDRRGGGIWASVRDVVTVVTSVSTIVLLVDRFNR
jgi:polysaccharide export outer membrane protein